MKKTYRFTLSQEEHSDIIKMFEKCPKPLRSELIVLAMRVLEKNKNEILTNNQDTKPTPSNQTQTSSIDIADAFKM